MSTTERDLQQKQREEFDRFAEELTASIEKFNIAPLDLDSKGRRRIRDLRRSRRRAGEDDTGFMTLVNVDGVLHWELGTGPLPGRYARKRSSRRGFFQPVHVEPVRHFEFENLPPNLVTKKLRSLDDWLTPNQGLRTVSQRDGSIGESDASPVKEGRILLFVHGTFSNCEHMIKELRSTPKGEALFRHLVKSEVYSQTLAFNHPTLSTSPILNAATLARCFRGSGVEVDIICHSRGGLVARWWREFLDHAPNRQGRVVFAGSPLAGTGLAAPAQLKGALDLLTNISETLQAISQFGAVFPGTIAMGQAAAVLFGWFGRITKLAAKTPIIDAGVQLIPGLAAQSREGANGELIQIRKSFSALSSPLRKQRLQDYFFLTSNFETEDPGWKFWKYFRKDKLFDVAATAVFEGDNDLVVDTSSMTDLADEFRDSKISTDNIHPFGDSSVVHHLNYFQQPESLSHIEKAFRLSS